MLKKSIISATAAVLLTAGVSTAEDIDIVFVGKNTGNPYFDSLTCLLYTSPSPRDATLSRMPSSA